MTVKAQQLTALHTQLRACRICADEGYEVIPGAVMSGTLSSKVMTIGQAPGVTEVEAKRPFNAGSGRRLFKWLGEAGFDEDAFRSTHYMTSVTKCYPGKHAGGKGDRVPSKVEQKLCRNYLERELAIVRPRVIVPIGGLAIKLFYPAKWPLKAVVGRASYLSARAWEEGGDFDLSEAVTVEQVQEDDEGGRYIVPLPHPSGASLWPNLAENKALIAQAIGLLRDVRVKWEL